MISLDPATLQWVIEGLQEHLRLAAAIENNEQVAAVADYIENLIEDLYDVLDVNDADRQNADLR